MPVPLLLSSAYAETESTNGSTARWWIGKYGACDPARLIDVFRPPVKPGWVAALASWPLPPLLANEGGVGGGLTSIEGIDIVSRPHNSVLTNALKRLGGPS